MLTLKSALSRKNTLPFAVSGWIYSPTDCFKLLLPKARTFTLCLKEKLMLSFHFVELDH